MATFAEQFRSRRSSGGANSSFVEKFRSRYGSVLADTQKRFEEEEKRKRKEEIIKKSLEESRRYAEEANNLRARAGEFIFGGGLKSAISGAASNVPGFINKLGTIARGATPAATYEEKRATTEAFKGAGKNLLELTSGAARMGTGLSPLTGFSNIRKIISKSGGKTVEEFVARNTPEYIKKVDGFIDNFGILNYKPDYKNEYQKTGGDIAEIGSWFIPLTRYGKVEKVEKMVAELPKISKFLGATPKIVKSGGKFFYEVGKDAVDVGILDAVRGKDWESIQEDSKMALAGGTVIRGTGAILGKAIKGSAMKAVKKAIGELNEEETRLANKLVGEGRSTNDVVEEISSMRKRAETAQIPGVEAPKAEPPLQEARKYYRGGERFTGDVGERGLPLTTDKSVAETFAKEKVSFRKSPAGKIMGMKPGDIVLEEYTISPSAKIATKNDVPKDIFEAYKKANPVTNPEAAEPIISRWARDNGYDAVDFSTLGKTSAKEAELKILNPKILQSQPLQEGGDKLLQEARKYKSAEEFADWGVIMKKDPVVNGKSVGKDFGELKDLVSFRKTSDFLKHGEYKFNEGVLKGKIGAGEELIQGKVDHWKARISKGERPIIIVEDKPYISKITDHLQGGREYDAILEARVRQGHSRLEAYRQLGIKKVPVVYKSQLTDIWNKANKSHPLQEGVEKVARVERPVPGRETKESEFAKRLNKELPDDLKIDETYTTTSLKKEAIDAVEMLEKDPERLAKIANGEIISDANTQTAALIALKNRAMQEGDMATGAALLNKRRLANTRRGQEIAMEKLSVRTNPEERFINELIESRMANVKTGVSNLLKKMKVGGKTKNKIVADKIATEAKEFSSSLKLSVKVKQAQEVFNNLICK